MAGSSSAASASPCSLALLLCTLLGLLYARKLSRPLGLISQELAVVAEGDYSHRLPQQDGPEFTQIADSYNHLVKRLAQAERDGAELEQARHDLIANISDDLRTPLTSITGFAERMTEADLPPAERQRYAEIIGRRVAELDALLGDLITLSRLQALPNLNREPHDLAELTRERIIELMPEVESAGLQLSVDLPEHPLTLPVDQRLIGRALTNLITNALRHARGATHIHVALRREGAAVALSVADDGPGIPPEERPRLFDRYYRGTSATAQGQGTGLGLAIVKQVATSHGGRVDLHVDGGTTITIMLPLSG